MSCYTQQKPPVRALREKLNALQRFPFRDDSVALLQEIYDFFE